MTCIRSLLVQILLCSLEYRTDISLKKIIIDPRLTEYKFLDYHWKIIYIENSSIMFNLIFHMNKPLHLKLEAIISVTLIMVRKWKVIDDHWKTHFT